MMPVMLPSASRCGLPYTPCPAGTSYQSSHIRTARTSRHLRHRQHTCRAIPTSRSPQLIEGMALRLTSSPLPIPSIVMYATASVHAARGPDACRWRSGVPRHSSAAGGFICLPGLQSLCGWRDGRNRARHCLAPAAGGRPCARACARCQCRRECCCPPGRTHACVHAGRLRPILLL